MKKTVAIKADKVRNLKYGINSLIELEELLGRPLSSMQDGSSLADLRKILFIGLKWEDKELTLVNTGEIMDTVIEESGMNYLSEQLGKAMQGAMGTSFPQAK
ncbi:MULTISPECIES: hypothetical protein [Gammaproteobacteria]|uniref:hypothetical protein n=1 Tax=Acinetobacter sp. HRXRD-152 TaxID=3404808 RepID=UPI003BB6219F